MGKWLVCPSRDSQARYGGGLENHWSLTSGVRISLSAPFLHSGTSMERRWLCPIEFGSPTNNTTSVTSSHGIVKSFRRGFSNLAPILGLDCVELPEIGCESGDVLILVSDVFEEILLVQLGEYGIQLGLDVSTVAERYPL